ncbi:Eukaryotic aspartyl protease family protein [Rhynchospora pubera]|uniref:Eukaryotic aspartyl protease family protein n=1 Tax=Rhynchospora pubera TaxID=906938 RepID=A0AAV8G0H5_9POAL|nr:Eukaryotic aspartyl protease family protein [Rhynchospora pubera]
MATNWFPLLISHLLFLSFPISVSSLQNLYEVDVHSLMPSNVCSSPKDTKPRLRVVDRYSPCSALPQPQSFSHEQILSNDQLRVDSIQGHISAVSGRAKNSDPLASSKITAQYGGSFGIANYIVSIGIGTPSKTLTVAFDTGSDVTWIQCEPCQQYCYPQLESIFDPSQSSTFANVSCNSNPCKDVGYDCLGSSCLYGVLYGDGSYTLGYYAEDTLTITPDVISNFRFGCGQNNNGTFGGIAGLLGLGPASESFVSQTSYKYNRVFAYCLPALSSSTGYLNFGTDSNLPNTQRTPIPKSPRSPFYYYLNMTGLSVAGESLKIQSKVFSKAGTIIDSGTVITRLPPDAYKALRSKFRKRMKQYKMAPSFSLFDTCYDFTGLDSVLIPSVGVQFLNNVTLDLDPNGILYVLDISQVCLAFASNRRRTDLGIFGNVQQRTFNVVYDVPNGEIGFSSEAC